jgi:hypothetical protein
VVSAIPIGTPCAGAGASFSVMKAPEKFCGLDLESQHFGPEIE